LNIVPQNKGICCPFYTCLKPHIELGSEAIGKHSIPETQDFAFSLPQKKHLFAEF